MNKYILPVFAVMLLLSTPAQAETISYHDPFNSLFDAMIFAPQRIDSRTFSTPRMNVADLTDKIEITAELPGISEKDVNLTIEDGILTLSGERNEEKEEQAKDYYLKEFSSGSFSRSIRLPKNIDESKTEAVFKNGILTITIPKIEAKDEVVKKIPIKTAE